MSRAEHGADVDQLLDTLVFVVEERVRNRIACWIENDKGPVADAELAAMIRRGECG